MKSTVAAILLLACVALVNSGAIPARQMNTNINENDNSNDNILFNFLVSIAESGPQKPIPTHKPRPPTYKPRPPTYKPRPPTYKPRPPTYKPQPPTYKPQPPTYKPQPPAYKPQPPIYKPTTEYNSGRPSYTTPTPIDKPCKYCSTSTTSDDSGEKPFGFDFDDLFDFKMGKDAQSSQKSNEAMQVPSDDVFQSQTNFREASPQSETSRMESATMESEN